MKKLISLLMAMALLLSCVGFAAAEDAVNLMVWIGGDKETDWINGVIEAFQAANPDTTYNITVGVVTYETVGVTALQDPEATADVFVFPDDRLHELVRGGLLQPVVVDTEAVIERNGGEGSGAMAASMVDGQLYAYPLSASNGYFMFYNSEYFTPEDVSSFDSMAKIAAEHGKQVSFPVMNPWYSYGFYAAAGLSVGLDEDGVSNVCDWNTKTDPFSGLQVLQALLDLVATPGFTDADSDAFVASVKDGSIIAGVSGTWNANIAKEAWGDSYAATKLPTYTLDGQQVQIRSFAGYKLVGVNSYSPNVGDAMDFANFMTDYDSQMSRFILLDDGPSNIQAAASDEVMANPAIAALAAQSDFADPQQVGGYFWEPAYTLGAIIVAGNPEGTDLQTLLDNTVAGIVTPIQ